MISLWMLYSAGVASLLGIAALALERVLLANGRPVRRLWAAALALSLILPALAVGPSAGAVGKGGVTIDLTAAEVIAAVPAAESAASGRLRLERALAAGWLLASIVLLAAVLLSLAWLERQQRRWRHGILAGRAVLVAPNTGPAVVGLLWPEIVVPRWVFGWDEGAQRLLLTHEREHLRAGDSHLLLCALASVVLMPWNPALWWQLRRLRLAIELDCDARVLRAEPRRHEYGTLLLEVGRRASRAYLPAAAFSESRSLLEHRIRAMAAPPALSGRARAGLAALALTALAVACELPDPARPDLGRLLPSDLPGGGPSGVPASSQTQAPDPSLTPYTQAPELLTSREEVARILEGAYPPMLRAAGVGGTVVVWTFVDGAGRVADTRAEGARAELALAARRAVRALRFSPARNGEAVVPVWIQFPVRFGTGEPVRPGEASPGAAAGGAETVALPLWSGPRGSTPPSSTPTVVDVRPELRNREEIGPLLERHYPPLLREAGMGGTVVLWVHVDARGAVRETGVARTSGLAVLDSAAREVMSRARFTAATLQGQSVDAWIQVPVSFRPE